MTEQTVFPHAENPATISGEWKTDDDVDWRSYVEGTRSKYITRYAIFAQQNTANFSLLEQELANFMNAAQQAWVQRAYNAVLEMVEWLWSSGGQFLDLKGHFQEGLQLLSQAENAARLLEDKSLLEGVLGQLGRASMALRNWPAAAEYLEQALIIAREIENRQGEASHLGNLGQLLLQIAYETGYMQGDVGIQMKNQQKAAENFREALQIASEIGDQHMEGRLLASLGLVKLRDQILTGYTREKMSEVIKHFKNAITIAWETGDQRGEASHLGSLGDAYELMGLMNLSLPPFKWGSPTPGKDADRYSQYQKELESANQDSYLTAYEYYSHALSIARKIGDVQMQENFDGDRARVGPKAGLPLYPDSGEVNVNIWMRNNPDPSAKRVPGTGYG